jgi:phosphoribosylformylglycinamidine cyclo-ligase
VSSKVDYKSAGVDIEAGNEAVRRMKAHVQRTHSAAVLTGLGSFGTMFSLADALKGMAEHRRRRHQDQGDGDGRAL